MEGFVADASFHDGGEVVFETEGVVENEEGDGGD